ncbi:hypothetical protein HHK36_004303 [Tetracentron sinense]|uniref:HTH La-type RNA-binding domain-containing protein n=1 Tax=Tetracentron sinense TaxID=13715 RepID=A0A834ZUN5_TETSI|nr:hypothetical protein HHK36_004303 [Tetracentron sinense]
MSTASSSLFSQNLVLVSNEISSNTQDSAITGPHQTFNNNEGHAIGNSSWKKISLPEKNPPALVMGTSSWPDLSPPPLSPEVQLQESSSDNATIACENSVLPVSETEDTNADEYSDSSPTASYPEGETVVPSTLSSEGAHFRSDLAHPVRPFNYRHNQNYQNGNSSRHNQQRRNGFNTRGGNRGGGHGFQKHNYSNRHYQQRGFNDWNRNSGFNARVVNFQHEPCGIGNGPVGPPPLPHSTAIVYPPYVSVSPPPLLPPPVPGYMLPFGYYGDPYFPEASTPLYCAPVPVPVPVPVPQEEAIRGAPYYPEHWPPYNLPHPEVVLCSKILYQIEYYFSKENLDTDDYLRSKMDAQGWVPVGLIAGFKMIKAMTSDIQLILRALQPSAIVEVQGDEVRRRGDWMTYISARHSLSTTQTGPLQHTLLSGIQNIQLDGEHKQRAESNTVSMSSDVSNNISKESMATITGSSEWDSVSQEHPRTEYGGEWVLGLILTVIEILLYIRNWALTFQPYTADPVYQPYTY